MNPPGRVRRRARPTRSGGCGRPRSEDRGRFAFSASTRAGRHAPVPPRARHRPERRGARAIGCRGGSRPQPIPRPERSRATGRSAIAPTGIRRVRPSPQRTRVPTPLGLETARNGAAGETGAATSPHDGGRPQRRGCRPAILPSAALACTGAERATPREAARIGRTRTGALRHRPLGSGVGSGSEAVVICRIRRNTAAAMAALPLGGRATPTATPATDRDRHAAEAPARPGFEGCARIAVGGTGERRRRRAGRAEGGRGQAKRGTAARRRRPRAATRCGRRGARTARSGPPLRPAGLPAPR